MRPMQPATTERARSFDAWAPEYDRYRPPYPPALFDLVAARLQLPAAPLVADLGAGTGRASLAMAERGWRVTAVDPGRPMLDVLRARAADAGLPIASVVARAEHTGLDPASVDLATVAQAYHWFERSRALREMARIVRPGGGIAIFWNTRDARRSPLIADFHDLLRASVGGDDSGQWRGKAQERTRKEIRGAGGFDEPELHLLEHEVTVGADDFIGLAFTASYVRLADASVQARLREQLEQLIARHHPDAPFSVPYVTDCWIAGRSG
jgi:SAM-dependent methyltransferase